MENDKHKKITCGQLKKIIVGLEALPKEVRTPEINKILSNAKHDARHCTNDKYYAYRNRL